MLHRMGIVHLVLLLAAIVFACAPPRFAYSSEKGESSEVSYYRDIRPIFQEHCQGCHQPAKRGGEYVMTSFKDLLEGGRERGGSDRAGQPGRKQSRADDHARRGRQGGDAQGQAGAGRVADRADQGLDQGGAKDDTPESATQRSTRRIRRSISRRR